MFKKFKQFLIGGISEQVHALSEKFDSYNKEKTDGEIVITLLRHQLGSIDISDVPDEEMSFEERKEYLGRVASVVFPIIEKKYKKFVRYQEHFMAFEADGNDQLFFSRGSINGLGLLYEEFKKENTEFIEMSRPLPKFDKHKVMESMIIDEK